MPVSNIDRKTYMDMFDDNYQQSGFRAQLKAYTDGCSHPLKEPHSGGWAFVMLEDHDRGADIDDILDVDYGGKLNTTNNEMELTAIVKAVEWCPMHADLTIVTDSQYCISSLSYDRGKVEKNAHVISRFFQLSSEKDVRCTFKWVKGHSTDQFNNYADVLSNAGDAEVRLPTAR